MSELISGKDKMKTAEFLNTKANYMLQVLPEHAGDDPESGLVKVPKGADMYAKMEQESKPHFRKITKDDVFIWSSNNWKKSWLDTSSKILWQRNTLQQKVNEVRQHLGITSNDKLSLMIGRESSYIRKLLKRKVSAKTQDKVIEQLDELIKQPLIIELEKPKEELIQDYINELKDEIKQANEIAEMWEENYKLSSKLNAWLFFIFILFISLFITWWAL